MRSASGAAAAPGLPEFREECCHQQYLSSNKTRTATARTTARACRARSAWSAPTAEAAWLEKRADRVRWHHRTLARALSGSAAWGAGSATAKLTAPAASLVTQNDGPLRGR